MNRDQALAVAVPENLRRALMQPNLVPQLIAELRSFNEDARAIVVGSTAVHQLLTCLHTPADRLNALIAGDVSFQLYGLPVYVCVQRPTVLYVASHTHVCARSVAVPEFVVSLEEVERLRTRLQEIDGYKLTDITWTRNGAVVEVDSRHVQGWAYMGLSNSYFPQSLEDK